MINTTILLHTTQQGMHTQKNYVEFTRYGTERSRRNNRLPLTGAG